MEIKLKRSIPGIKAELANDELMRLYKKDGKITAPRVVEIARPKDAVLHPAFEWRDKQAAEEYRLIQARHLIRQVVIFNAADKTENPAFVHVRVVDQAEGAYHPIEVVAEDTNLFAAAYEEALEKLAGAKRAIDALERIAKRADEPDRVAAIMLAMQSIEVAREAIQTIH